jgi:quercetin dioxygenase-like cupin family protein
MTPITDLTEVLPMPKAERAMLTLLDLKGDTKLVLAALPAGAQVPAHQVPYPASVVLLSGSIEVLLGEAWKRVDPGETAAVPANLLHAVRATESSYFLAIHLRALGA